MEILFNNFNKKIIFLDRINFFSIILETFRKIMKKNLKSDTEKILIG